MNRRTEIFKSAMAGGAIGDALGYPYEFKKNNRVPLGDVNLTPSHIITDDTQMSLCVARAVDKSCPHDNSDIFASNVVDEFVEWSCSDDIMHRAPGNTCLTACDNLKSGKHWSDSGVLGSKGSGTIMRAHPVAFIENDNRRRQYNVIQTIVTHAHPISLIATVVWVELLHSLFKQRLDDNFEAREYLSSLVNEAESIVDNLDLVEIQSYLPPNHPTSLKLDKGVAGTKKVLQVIHHQYPDNHDICSITGEGWVGEESLATTLLTVSKYGLNPVEAIRRAATCDGDSDTIASMVGVMIGMIFGIDVFPSEWVDNIEKPYDRELLNVSQLYSTSSDW